MKVGVFLSNIAPTAGGGFTFEGDVLQALATLKSKHTFVVFADLTKDQTGEVFADHLQFVSLQRGVLERASSKVTWFTANVVKRLPIIRNWFQVTYTPWLRQVVNDFGINVLWFIYPFGPPYYNELDIPYIFTVWDLQHRLQPWFPEVSAHGRWHRREQTYATAIPRASVVIAGTEAGKAEIINFYQVPPERVKLVPHPTPRFALSASLGSGKEVLTKYHIPEGYLFYPAQFWPHKNHVGLLLAVSLLRERYDLTLPVVFVGQDKGNEQYIRQMVNTLGLSTQVYFLGFVPQDDLVGLYCNALALTYLSFFGPENLPPLEAFALRCPVVASNVSGAQEQLGDAALLVDPKDEKQIALAIKALYDDPALRQTLMQRGWERATKWTSEDFVKSIFSILDEFEPALRCWNNLA